MQTRERKRAWGIGVYEGATGLEDEIKVLIGKVGQERRHTYLTGWITLIKQLYFCNLLCHAQEILLTSIMPGIQL